MFLPLDQRVGRRVEEGPAVCCLLCAWLTAGPPRGWASSPLGGDLRPSSTGPGCLTQRAFSDLSPGMDTRTQGCHPASWGTCGLPGAGTQAEQPRGPRPPGKRPEGCPSLSVLGSSRLRSAQDFCPVGLLSSVQGPAAGLSRPICTSAKRLLRSAPASVASSFRVGPCAGQVTSNSLFASTTVHGGGFITADQGAPHT